MFYEGTVSVFIERSLQLFFGVHNDRSIPGYRLTDRLTRDQKKTSRLVQSGRNHLVPRVELDQLTVYDPSLLLQIEINLPFDHVSQHGMVGFGRMVDLNASREAEYPDIQDP